MTSITNNKIMFHKFILEPLSTIIKLAILGKKNIGCKISISNNQIYIQESGFFQGISRYYMGLTKNDIHYLLTPIQIACERYLTLDKIKEIPNIVSIFSYAQLGINNIMKTYIDYPIIIYCLKYYNSIIDSYIIKSTKINDINLPLQSNNIFNSKIYTDKLYTDKLYTNSILSCIIDKKLPDKKLHDDKLPDDKLPDKKYKKLIKKNIESDNVEKNIESDNVETNIEKNIDNVEIDNVEKNVEIDNVEKNVEIDNVEKNIDNVETNIDPDNILKESKLLYTDELLNKFDLMWDNLKIEMILSMINYLSSENSVSEYAECIETFMKPIDKETLKIIKCSFT